MSLELSVIVPVYNEAQYLSDCIASILSNTYYNYEVLLIDDGSTDDTPNICDRLADLHPRIRVFHTENRGLAEARNLGLERAQGRYISFVDADDIVSSKLFEKLVSNMAEDVQMSVCGFCRCAERNPVPEQAPDGCGVKTLALQSAAEQILHGGYGHYVWNKLFQKEILEQHQIRFLRDCRAIEDIYFTWEYLSHCEKIVFLKEPLYAYISTSGSIMDIFRSNRVVSDAYMNLPWGWRFCASVLSNIAPEQKYYAIAKAEMFYQTVLRKLKFPSEEYIREARAYVRTNLTVLLHFRWGIKYFLSALLLSFNYSLWAKVFRYGIPSEAKGE